MFYPNATFSRHGYRVPSPSVEAQLRTDVCRFSVLTLLYFVFATFVTYSFRDGLAGGSLLTWIVLTQVASSVSIWLMQKAYFRRSVLGMAVIDAPYTILSYWSELAQTKTIQALVTNLLMDLFAISTIVLYFLFLKNGFPTVLSILMLVRLTPQLYQIREKLRQNRIQAEQTIVEVAEEQSIFATAPDLRSYPIK